MKKKDLVVGIDVGTTHIRVIVGEPLPDGSINIIGVGLSPSEGLKKGIIVDLDETVQAITNAVEEAERMIGSKIEEACIGLPGLNVELVSNKGVVAVTSEDREIGDEDVDRVMQATRVIALPSDRDIVEVMPREFIVDGYDGIKDPIGMLGVRLEVDALVVTSPITSMRNLERCVNRADINVNELILQPLANAETSLSKDEKELGVFLLDMGGGKTELSFFQNGILQQLSVVPVGGNHITNDLAVGLRTSFKSAESLKLEYGCAFSAMADPESKLEIVGVGGKQVQEVSERELASFIEPRVQEILQLSKDAMIRMGWEETPPAGVVLTGGVSLMDGVTEMAEKIFGGPVRIAQPKFVGVQSPIYTTAVGIVYSTLKRNKQAVAEKKKPERKANQGVIGRVWHRLSSWLAEVFE